MFTKNSLLALVLSTTLVTSAISDSSLEDKAKNKLTDNLNQGVSTLSSKISEGISSGISSFVQEHFENMKYLDFEINAQEHLKPTFNIMSVTELLKINAGTIFNQTSINTHDNDETINIGLGIRKLLNDNKILIGSNIFYDHQFTKNHKRTGMGVEAISSVFDVRGNYYNALSGTRNTSEGSERALDGWDTQLDYHLPGKHDVNFFVNTFAFKNPDKVSNFRDKGNKFGANAKLGKFVIEGGYIDDNQNTDSYYGSVKFVVKLDKFSSNAYKLDETRKKRNYLEYTDISGQLYQPVKRENKIKLVKISKSGVKVSGF